MDIGQLSASILAAAGSGIISALGTMKGLGVHLSYIKEQLADLKKAVERAHTRLDANDRRVDDLQRRVELLEKNIEQHDLSSKR